MVTLVAVMSCALGKTVVRMEVDGQLNVVTMKVVGKLFNVGKEAAVPGVASPALLADKRLGKACLNTFSTCKPKTYLAVWCL
jgi:uncharacterized membrane protein